MTGALVARLDAMGDVLLAGPAVRGVAAAPSPVSMLASGQGAAAARLLPGVGRVLTFEAPWVPAEAPPVRAEAIDELVRAVADDRPERALVLTSFHQSPLPLALLLRLAGVPWIGAVSVDYPGSLLDLRHTVPDDLHEVERSLSLAAAAGCALGPGDDGALAVDLNAAPCPPEVLGLGPVDVVLHPGASVPARTWPVERFAEAARALAVAGWRVAVTGGPAERSLTARVAGACPSGTALDLGGALPLSGLAHLLARAGVLVTGNTGPAHLAAAVGIPVVSLYPPTVPARRWRPWRVPTVLLGDQGIACAGCRARRCPFGEHQPCLSGVAVTEVLSAVEHLAGTPAVAARRVGAEVGP